MTAKRTGYSFAQMDEEHAHIVTCIKNCAVEQGYAARDALEIFRWSIVREGKLPLACRDS